MKVSIIFFLIVLPFAMHAQLAIDRTKAPAPAPAPEIKVAEPASFVLPNGLKVFVVQNNKLPSVSATLTIDRDPVLEGGKAGMVSMAGELIRRGTEKMNKATLDEEIDFLGASINTSDKSISGASLKDNFSKLMALMADIALKPSFPADELEKIRKQELSGLEQAKDNPSTIAENVVNSLLYGKDHPYGELETEETVGKITVDDIKNYYNTYWKPNIAYLVFVGDIKPAEAKKLAVQYFGKWQKGDLPQANFTVPKAPAKRYIALVDRPASVQSVIRLVYPVALKPGSADDIPSSVMNNILGGGFSGRLFSNLREKHGFTYGAYSKLNADKLIGSFDASASVRNEKTDSAVGAFLEEFERIKKDTVNGEELTRMKNYLSGSFARSLERPATIANFALNVARYNLPGDYYQGYLKNLAAVNGTEVKSMADRYVQPDNLLIVIVGNAKEIVKGLDKYGEVKYVDIYGNAVAAP
jgi:predicted Zn-dependent peptidase